MQKREREKLNFVPRVAICLKESGFKPPKMDPVMKKVFIGDACGTVCNCVTLIFLARRL